MFKVQTFTEPLKLLHRLPLVHFKYFSIDTVTRLVKVLVTVTSDYWLGYW